MDGGVHCVSDGELDYGFGGESGLEDFVLPDRPTARGAATSWRVYPVVVSDMWWSLPLVGREFLAGFEDLVGYGGGFDGGADVVGADDVGAGEDGGYVCGGGGVEAIFHGRCAAVEKNRQRRVLGEGVGEEAFARGPARRGG